MARKRSTAASKTTQLPMPSPDTATPRRDPTGPALRTDARSRFTLYNLLGRERSWYGVTRRELERPAEPVGEKSVAHGIIVIDRSGSMSFCIEDLKDTLVKLLTLEEYRNFNLLVTLISYSGRGDVTTHFERAPITEIMKRDSKQLKEIKKIHATFLTCMSQGLEQASKLVRDDELTAITLHTDGYANDPSPNSEAKAIDKLLDAWREKALLVNTIAYSDYSDFRLLSKIANAASGVCLKAGNIREVFDSLNNTARLLGGQLTPPIEEPLSPEYDYQVFVSHSAGKINGSAGPLFIRGLKPEDDAAVYKFRKLSQAEFDKLKDADLAQTSEAVAAFARAQLAEGNLNTAKYALASTFDRTLFDRHSRALTNNEVAALAQDLDLLLFQPGLLNEHEVSKEVPVNRRIPLLSLVRILDDHKEGFLVNFDHLRQNYIRRGLRRVQGTRDETGKLVEPWLKTEFVDKGDYVKVSSFDINRNTANLNILVPRKVRLVPAAGGKPIAEVAGVKLDNLSNFNNYTVVGDGELSVKTLKVKITEKALYDALAKEGVLEIDGAAPKKYDKDADYTLRLDLLPLVPPFEGSVNLDGVFDQLAEYKGLSSVCAAHLKEDSDVFTPEQVEELKRHYLTKNLYLSFPTTTEYTDRDQALAEGTIDTRTSYKIDLGSRTILNLSKLHSANKFLERMYEVTNAQGQKLDKPKFEDCLDGATYRHKQLSARTKVTRVDEFMKRLFDDFLGVAPNGSAVAVLERVGAKDLAAIVKERGKGKQPARAAFVKALTQAGKALDRAADALFNEKVSPLVFYVGSTGALPDEIEARAMSAEEVTTKYPELSPSKDEQEGLFFEVGQSILTVYAKTEYFSHDKSVSGGVNVAVSARGLTPVIASTAARGRPRRRGSAGAPAAPFARGNSTFFSPSAPAPRRARNSRSRSAGTTKLFASAVSRSSRRRVSRDGVPPRARSSAGRATSPSRPSSRVASSRSSKRSLSSRVINRATCFASTAAGFSTPRKNGTASAGEAASVTIALSASRASPASRGPQLLRPRRGQRRAGPLRPGQAGHVPHDGGGVVAAGH
ncbi:MAG: vWA domain-containing protein [Gemmataceae bacterium]